MWTPPWTTRVPAGRWWSYSWEVTRDYATIRKTATWKIGRRDPDGHAGVQRRTCTDCAEKRHQSDGSKYGRRIARCTNQVFCTIARVLRDRRWVADMIFKPIADLPAVAMM